MSRRSAPALEPSPSPPRSPTKIGRFALVAGCAAAMLGACGDQGADLQGSPSSPDRPSAGQGGDPSGLDTLGGPPSSSTFTKEELEAQRKAREAVGRARWLKRKETFALKAGETLDQLWARGEKERDAQNHKDAADAFTGFAVHAIEDARAPEALRFAMIGRFALTEYQQGFDLVEDAILHLEDPNALARVHRFVGNTYLAVPHWGTTRGGELLRGRSEQGLSTQTYRQDRERAIAHLERARELMAKHALPPPKDPPPGAQGKGAAALKTNPDDVDLEDDQKRVAAPLTYQERVDTQLDLVGAVARFTRSTPPGATGGTPGARRTTGSSTKRAPMSGPADIAGRATGATCCTAPSPRPAGDPLRPDRVRAAAESVRAGPR